MKKYKVTSSSDRGVKYLIKHFPTTDKFVCECPAYKFGKPGAECKHIKKVRAYIKAKNL